MIQKKYYGHHQEVDYIEEYDGKMHAYEIKWNPNVQVKFPKSLLNSYNDIETRTIKRIILWIIF